MPEIWNITKSPVYIYIYCRSSLKAFGVPTMERKKASDLLTALQDVLEAARVSGERKRLSQAATVMVGDRFEVLRITSGAQRGLGIIAALQDIVTEEGKVGLHMYMRR